MRFDNDTRTRIFITETLSFDPASATIELKIDSTWYPAEWLGAATGSGTAWTREARTTGYFAGPTHPTPAGATVLSSGRHRTETRVTNGGDTIVHSSTPIDVT